MKKTHLLVLPLVAASTAAMAAPVTKATVLNTQAGVVSQLANLQVIIGTMQFINETVQNNNGVSSGNCDPDQDGKADGTATNSGPTQQTVASGFLTGDETSLAVTRRTWTKCALLKYTDTVQQQGTNMPISLAFIRNGVRDKAGDKALGDRTIKFTRFGETTAKPLLNTLSVSVGPGKVSYTDPRTGKAKTQTIPKVTSKFDFKNFYQLETRDNNIGNDQDALLYESTMDFNKYLTITGSIGDSKANKATGKPNTPFLITRDGNKRITAVEGVYGVNVKAPKGTLTALANSCQAPDPKKPLVMGAAKVLTITPLTTSNSYSGFGLFNTFGGFTGGELRFSDTKTDCRNLNDPKVADKCAVIKFNDNGTMNIKPAAKGATLGSAISQSSQYSYPMCTAAFILGPTAAFNAFLED